MIRGRRSESLLLPTRGDRRGETVYVRPLVESADGPIFLDEEGGLDLGQTPWSEPEGLGEIDGLIGGWSSVCVLTEDRTRVECFDKTGEAPLYEPPGQDP